MSALDFKYVIDAANVILQPSGQTELKEKILKLPLDIRLCIN